MADFPDRWRLALQAMRPNASAGHTPAQLASRLGWDVEETTDLLADLDLAGLITVRESEDSGLVVSPVPVVGGTDPRPAAPVRNAYARPSRPRMSATTAGSVTS